MPIFEYQCRNCHHQFEWIVVPSNKTETPACPECAGQNLERLTSGFAVNSPEMSRANVRKAKKAIAASRNYKDQKVAEVEHINEHIAEYMPPPEEPTKKVKK